MFQTPLIIIRGAGDLATGVALRLYRSGFKRIILLETPNPLAVRRTVAFSEAVHHGITTVESVCAELVWEAGSIEEIWQRGHIPIIVDPTGKCIPEFKPELVVDAIIAKRNLGTNREMAPLTIGLGPGFTAGKDVHTVIETMRGHYLGRVIKIGSAIPNTGIPGIVAGHSLDRVYWADKDGLFTTSNNIGDMVQAGETIGAVNREPVTASISGILRGLLRNSTPVKNRTKLADIDPRGVMEHCNKVSDKAMAIGGGVLEAINSYLFSGKLI